MTKKKKPEEKKKAGRPTIFNNDVLQKLKHAFALGETDENACKYAKIAVSSLYNYQKENPEFLKEKEGLKLNPILKAKNTIYENLDDPKIAQWFLERKRKDEFSTKIENELKTTGINIMVADEKHKKMLEDL